MNAHLDNLSRQLFQSRNAKIVTGGKVRFGPSDEDWRTEVANFK